MQLRTLIVGLAFLSASPAYAAHVLVSVNEKSQQMTVSVDGEQQYVWPVSTGIARYATPTGTYTPFRMEEYHFSEEWDDAPMPHSIFFTRLGHAIHGTEHLASLGRPASHGCVRLAPENAETLYTLVQEVGLPNTTVVLTGGKGETISQKAAPRPVEGPPQVLVDNPPQEYLGKPQRLVENPSQQFIVKPRERLVENPQSRRLRRSDDPFLDSFN